MKYTLKMVVLVSLLVFLGASSASAFSVNSSIWGKDVSEPNSSYTGGVVRVEASPWVADFKGENVYDTYVGPFPIPVTWYFYQSMGLCNVVDIQLGNGCGFNSAQVVGGNVGGLFEPGINPYNEEIQLVLETDGNHYCCGNFTKTIYTQGFAGGAHCFAYDTNAWQGTGTNHAVDDAAFLTVDFLC